MTKELERVLSTKWTAEEEMLYLRLMIQGRKEGKMGERFKTGFYKEVVVDMKKVFPDRPYSSSRLNTKRAEWKRKWDWFIRLFGKIGFSFNEDNGWFSVEPQNWEDMREGPLRECWWFKDHPMPYKAELEQLFSKSMATGAYARRSAVKKAVIDEEEDTAAGEDEEEGEPIPWPLSDDEETY